MPPAWLQMQAAMQHGPLSMMTASDMHQQQMMMMNLGFNLENGADTMMPYPYGPQFPTEAMPSVEQILSTPLNPDATPFCPPGQRQEVTEQQSAPGNDNTVLRQTQTAHQANRNNRPNRKPERRQRKKVAVNADDFETLRG